KECDVTPILLFNEADAIFGNRFESVRSSVEKMDNTIQNIILEEMEKLDGILIATTNLTGNLDKAFDRRFLFKIEFKRPDKEVRKSIWQSLMPDLNSDYASVLAGEFDLSGGQIENVARKSSIEYIISGNEVSLSQMRTFCLEERLNRCTHNRIGF
ncbi:MAG: ATP-binding protein, partial [Muribaculaceae bacterium]|nr:ATP-binding protein [Muribaculaceae bacterium]